jgi:hypothetical protein
MKLNNRFIFGILSLVLAAVIAFVALPTIARQIQDLGSGELFCVPTAEFSLRDTSKSRKHNNRLFWAFCN